MCISDHLTAENNNNSTINNLIIKVEYTKNLKSETFVTIVKRHVFADFEEPYSD